MAKKQPDTNIPQHEIEALARCLLPEIQKFFESPEGKKEFEEWKAQRAKEAEKKNQRISGQFICNKLTGTHTGDFFKHF